MTKTVIYDNTKRKPITALKAGTFFVLHKDSNPKDVICIKLDDEVKFFDFDECRIHSYGDVDYTAPVLLCKLVDIYVRNKQSDWYYRNFNLHYPELSNQGTIVISDLSLTAGSFFISIYHPMKITEDQIFNEGHYDNHLYLKVSDNEYFDLENCVIHPIDENGNDWYVNKLDNVEISVSI